MSKYDVKNSDGEIVWEIGQDGTWRCKILGVTASVSVVNYHPVTYKVEVLFVSKEMEELHIAPIRVVAETVKLSDVTNIVQDSARRAKRESVTRVGAHRQLYDDLTWSTKS